MKTLVLALSLATAAIGAELPTHAHNAGGGWWECDRGYLMRDHACVSEADAAREPKMVVSTLQSAGGGSLQTSGSPGSAPGISASAPASLGPLFIQTSQPWTVVLDAAGNPSAVIVGGPESRPAPSALFGR